MSGISNVTRTRTGCRTCRRRRKKCDERKPMCRNCEKTNLVCEGFPPRVRWQQQKEETNLPSTSRRASEPSIIGLSSSTFNITSTSDNQDYGYSMSQEQPPPLFHQTSAGLLGRGDQAYNTLGSSFDDGIEATIFTPLGLPPVPESSQALFGPVMPAGGFYNMPLRVAELPQEMPQLSMPPELPFFLSGLDSTIQRRLFCHFTREMSQVLTACSNEYNPMNSVVIQLGLSDETVMDSILCLSASHILKLQGPTLERELLVEKNLLHESAVLAQAQRTQSLVQSARDAREPYAGRNPNMLFATSILLCLYEICEGTGDEACRLHLNMARQIITSLSSAPERNTNSNTVKYTVPDIDPFLLEFFVYHDSMASVTMTSPENVQNYVHRVSTKSSSDVTMIGVQDGLVDFVPRIAALREQAKASKSPFDGNVISNAVSIWEDLNSWKHKTTFSPDHKLMAEFYQWSLFIWLFSIVNPDQKADRKIQDAVQRITSGMSEIKDNVRACLLFPLFVVGSAAINPKDRVAVETQFRKLREWSALGNVDLSYQVVETMWRDHDNGVPGSWDWVSQLQRQKMSFLVT